MSGMNSLHRNPFSQETRALFAWNKKCWKCGRTDRGVEPDHIFGRKMYYHKSPYNLAPLCRLCHNKKSRKWRKELFIKTAHYLKETDYKLTCLDVDFLKIIMSKEPNIYKETEADIVHKNCMSSTDFEGYVYEANSNRRFCSKCGVEVYESNVRRVFEGEDN